MPPTASQSVLRYARQRYAHDADVRRLLARHFLEYDAALLAVGDLAVGGGRDDLVAVLWAEEARRAPEFHEWPSMTLMREHVAAEAGWFDLRQTDLDRLAANQAQFQALASAWTQ